MLLVLAACRAEPSADAPVDNVEVANEVAEPLPDADINASLGLGIAGGPESSNQQREGTHRFVGRWAAEEGLCENAAWTITETELRTPAGSVCRFADVREAPGGYDIASRCTAEGPERDDVLELRFAESANALLFDSESIADVGLIRCEG
ncbi:hypothetical protein [Sphingosinicella sp. CPCC 101087]|uniref:hypothetical protein n=1 Tax=Sphingosinicella sp. CPCC 101087 TaxID=2497754 RepID=UPI00101C905B|nr:hypothetical protein [Sphingosinicella sp. CPCC 101087]